MALDKNLAALLNENARTIQVQFQHSLGEACQQYTYVTDLPISVVTGEGGQTAGLVIGSKVLVPTKIKAGGRYDNADPNSHMLLALGVCMSVAVVTGIDDCVKIQPDEDISYSWVICRIDTSNYFETIKRNDAIVALVQESYTQNLRKTFAQKILAELPANTAESVKLLLGGK